MTNCEECVYYEYDPETDANYCEADLDEDDMERFLRSANDACPFYRPGGEYRTARRQWASAKPGSPRLFSGGAAERHEKGQAAYFITRRRTGWWRLPVLAKISLDASVEVCYSGNVKGSSSRRGRCAVRHPG